MNEQSRPLFTVFTPTYNRASVLHRVYDSLCAQICRDFEWLIVDDGSTDNTRELLERWQAEADFLVRYVWQANGHKKAAFNRGVVEAQGELFLPLDSDDACPADALGIFRKHWLSIPAGRHEEFSGVSALCVDEAGQLVGQRFPQDVMESSPQEMAYRHRVGGEKWGFIRTDVLRQFPFPQDLPGHVPEGVAWGAIGARYKTLFVNEVVRVYFHSRDSIMVTGVQDARRNAAGQACWARQVLSQELGWFRFAPLWFVRMAVNWARFSLHDRAARGVILAWPQGFAARALCALCFPAGALLAWRDRRRCGVAS
ncbi:glycosyltransferase family 2 protein [Uliginosibacterium flavum]|uniref:Glycosyltransferase family A protein n=1 Tax=Uliginosibacterium flavum TaxID=1396831 RepID=A0ABV2TGV8_9RHOO